MNLTKAKLAGLIRTVTLALMAVGGFPAQGQGVWRNVLTLTGVGSHDEHNLLCRSLSVSVAQPPGSDGRPSGNGTLSFSALRNIDSDSPWLAMVAAKGRVVSASAVFFLNPQSSSAPKETVDSSAPDSFTISQKDSARSDFDHFQNGDVEQLSLSPRTNSSWSAPASLHNPSHGNPLLQIPGYSGDATNQFHSNWVALTSCGFPQVTSSGGLNATAQVGPMVLTKLTDCLSSTFMKDCYAGKIYKNLVLDGTLNVAGNRIAWYHLTLERAWISEMTRTADLTDISTPTAPLLEKIVLNPVGRVSVSYTEHTFDTNADTVATFYDYDTGSGGGDSFFNVMAIENTGDSSATVSWPAVEDTTYQLQQATSLTGPFTTILSYTATSTGIVTQQVPMVTPIALYRVQLPPD